MAEVCACQNTYSPWEIALWTVQFCSYPKKESICLFISCVCARHVDATVDMWKLEATVGTCSLLPHGS